MKTIHWFMLSLSVTTLQIHSQTFDLSTSWDSLRVLENPHKGWYHHYPDNSTTRYQIGSDAELDTFPGLDHIFIRLSWSHFEPTEGNFDWKWIDTVADHWVPKGYQIGIAITAKETGEKFATPEWVSKAGAKGAIVGSGYWEPDYGDSIFLSKLNHFHAALAARYGQKPWLAYVQMASYGSWGEGHNWPASNATYPFTTLKKHIDIYRTNYPGVRICISDDIYSVGVDAADKDKIKKYVEDNKELFWTDHSILVDYFAITYPTSVRSPELFESTWRNRPVQLELEHYAKVKGFKHWTVPDGAVTGASMLKAAMEVAHPTYMGYHGSAKEWLSDNPKITKELVNKMGYWYFPVNVVLPENTSALNPIPIKITWLNRGLAPAYRKYTLLIKLENGMSMTTQVAQVMDNTKWQPGTPITETYMITIPNNFAAGEYKMGICLQLDSTSSSRKVELALKESLRDQDGFYAVGKLKLSAVGIIKFPQPAGRFLTLPLSHYQAFDPTGRKVHLPFDFNPDQYEWGSERQYFLRAKE